VDRSFLQTWHAAAVTSLGLLGMAFWAFGPGCTISNSIQVFFTRERIPLALTAISLAWLGVGLVVG